MATNGADPWDDKTDYESDLKIYDVLRDYLEKSSHFRIKPMNNPTKINKRKVLASGDNTKLVKQVDGSKLKPKIKTNRHGYLSIECSSEQREKDEKRIREMMSQWWG